MTYKTDRFKNLPLFHAQYNDYITAPTSIPRDWAEHRNLVKKWKLWQWAAENYYIEGVKSGKHVGVHSSFVDFGRWNGTLDEFKKFFGVEPYVYDGVVPEPPIPPIPPEPEPDPFPYVGRVKTGGYTLWTHSEPNALVSTRNGYLPDGLDVVIKDKDNDGAWLQLRNADCWVSAKYIEEV